MFQRIARRHEDRSDEPVASETSADGADGMATAPVDAQQAPAEAEAEPEATAPTEPAPTPTRSDDDEDAPTQRLQAVDPATAPAQADAEQQTILQPAVTPPAPHSASVPPPKIDLRSRIAAGSPPQAAPAQPSEPTATAVTAPAPVAAQEPAPADGEAPTEAMPRRPGFRARGRMRRRLRYLRKLRELQVRDLGGLVFDLRRFERKRDDLVLQKIDRIRACDDELHALERALDERRDLRDVREPGIGGTCPRCFAIHGSADRFCANCGAALGGAVQGPAHAALPAQVPATPPAAGDPQP